MKNKKSEATKFIDSGAEFSPDRKFRFSLWRIWDIDKPKVMFIGLNPSTADETKPDRTIGRVVEFAKTWGFGGVYMLNCFPLVSSKPGLLKTTRMSAELLLNTTYLATYSKKCEEIIFAWGAFKIVKKSGIDQRMATAFPLAKVLRKNNDGSPEHPLYIPGDTVPFLYRRPPNAEEIPQGGWRGPGTIPDTDDIIMI